jgi:hypothetical protein
MGKRFIAGIAAAILLSMAAGSQAAPMLPKPYMFYQKGRSIVHYRHNTTFWMYFSAWRGKNRWNPQNISYVKMYLDGKKGKPLPPPPWYKVLKSGGTSGTSTGGNNKPTNGDRPPIPEPTSLAILGLGGMYLMRRKRND